MSCTPFFATPQTGSCRLQLQQGRGEAEVLTSFGDRRDGKGGRTATSWLRSSAPVTTHTHKIEQVGISNTISLWEPEACCP